jgi:hypothetical protein
MKQMIPTLFDTTTMHRWLMLCSGTGRVVVVRVLPERSLDPAFVLMLLL